MVFRIFLPLIKFQLRYLQILKCFPFAFNPSTQQLVVHYPTKRRWFTRLFQSLQWIYFISMFIPVTRLWRRGCYGKSLEGIFVIAVTTMCLTWCWSWNPNVKASRLLNALIKFDQEFMKSKKICRLIHICNLQSLPLLRSPIRAQPFR